MKSDYVGFSSCCGSGVDVDKLICLDCKEHCSVEYFCKICEKKLDEVGDKCYRCQNREDTIDN